MDGDEERGGDLLVRESLGRQPRDPLLRLGQLLRGRPPPAHARELVARSLDPESRPELLEDGKRLLERFTRATLLLRPAPHGAEREQRPPAFEWALRSLVLGERALERVQGGRQISL